ncbi:MAG: ASKHA domain-containing protein [Clostridiales bacterium]|nr:ASKHA domain-containing protein [Clostridiales bacterium]
MKARFYPGGRDYIFYENTTILQAAQELGLETDAPCGGHGKCGKCLVKVANLSMQNLAGFPGSQQKSGLEAEEQEVLACQTLLRDGMIIHLEKDRESDSMVVLSDGAKAEVTMNPIARAPYHAAIDIGTTTLACQILDGGTGVVIASGGALNPQQTFGADVVSRIQAAMNGDLPALTRLIRNALYELLSQSASQAGVSLHDIGLIGIVGNPCMQQLFEGISPDNLARPPFSVKLNQARVLPAGDFFPELPGARILSIPDIFGYVGADTMGCILSTDMDQAERPTLLVDIGTNGEMVLGSRGRLVACATAAGPALEGAGITFGMRGSAGAIDHVTMKDGRISCHVIGQVSEPDHESIWPVSGEDSAQVRGQLSEADDERILQTRDENFSAASGICGSGLIDAVALLRTQGIINRRGRLPAAVDCPAFAQYLGEKDGERIFCLTDTIYLTQEDIRQVQMAKGAIAAGIELMAKELQIEVREIEKVYLAGAFGSFIRQESACAIGLLPKELAGRIQVIGNAALEGCRRMVCDQKYFYHSETLSRQIPALDLASIPGFARSYAKHMGF